MSDLWVGGLVIKTFNTHARARTHTLTKSLQNRLSSLSAQTQKSVNHGPVVCVCVCDLLAQGPDNESWMVGMAVTCSNNVLHPHPAGTSLAAGLREPRGGTRDRVPLCMRYTLIAYHTLLTDLTIDRPLKPVSQRSHATAILNVLSTRSYNALTV